MHWTAQLNDYCERLGPGLWAEPVNFLSNAAFLLAALVMAWRCRALRAKLWPKQLQDRRGGLMFLRPCQPPVSQGVARCARRC